MILRITVFKSVNFSGRGAGKLFFWIFFSLLSAGEAQSKCKSLERQTSDVSRVLLSATQGESFKHAHSLNSIGGNNATAGTMVTRRDRDKQRASRPAHSIVAVRWPTNIRHAAMRGGARECGSVRALDTVNKRFVNLRRKGCQKHSRQTS